jgi:phosphoglycolate phosphatase
MRYKLCIFDFDGTLANTRGAVLKSMLSTLEGVSIDDRPITIDDIETVVATGPTLPDTFAQLLGPDASTLDIDAAVLRYRATYSEHANDWTTLYPGVASFLQTAQDQGMALAVVSNKGETALRASLDALGITGHFALILGEQTDLKPKPAPDIFDHRIVPAFPNISRQDMLFIGDTPADLGFAKAVGIDGCWASHGHGNEATCQAYAPVCIIDGLDDLAAFVGLDSST